MTMDDMQLSATDIAECLNRARTLAKLYETDKSIPMVSTVVAMVAGTLAGMLTARAIMAGQEFDGDTFLDAVGVSHLSKSASTASDHIRTELEPCRICGYTFGEHDGREEHQFSRY